MKIYLAALSTTCRPIAAVLADAAIPHEPVMVQLDKGEARTPEFLKLNPNAAVPVLVDEDFVLTESSAILKYVAEKHGSPLYPKEIRARARVNERMDWFNTQFAHNVTHDLVYPQLLPSFARGSEEGTRAAIAWGLDKTRGHLAVLERWLGESKHVAGDALTIADFFGASFASLPRVIGGTLAGFPRVASWLDEIEARPSWGPASAAFTGLQGHLASQGLQMVTLRQS